jgi:hypothetical protein
LFNKNDEMDNLMRSLDIDDIEQLRQDKVILARSPRLLSRNATQPGIPVPPR